MLKDFASRSERIPKGVLNIKKPTLVENFQTSLLEKYLSKLGLDINLKLLDFSPLFPCFKKTSKKDFLLTWLNLK